MSALASAFASSCLTCADRSGDGDAEPMTPILTAAVARLHKSYASYAERFSRAASSRLPTRTTKYVYSWVPGRTDEASPGHVEYQNTWW